MEAYEDGHKDLIEEDDTYSVSGVLFEGEKWYLVHQVCCGVICRVVSSGGGIGKMDRLCVWVKMWE